MFVGRDVWWLTIGLAVLLVRPVRADNLEQAWEIALQVSHQLEASAEQVTAAEETRAAAHAAHLPRWDSQAGYFVLNHEVAFQPHGLVPPQFLISVPVLQGDFPAALSLVSLPLYAGGRIRESVKAADATVHAAGADEARTVLDLKMAVAEAYVSVLYAQQIVTIAEASVASLEGHVRVTDDLVKQGLRPRADALAAHVQLADARQRALEAHNQLDVGRSTYNRLLGRCLTDPVELEDLTPGPYPEDVCALIDQAQMQRPELEALAQQADGLHHQAEAVRGELRPQVAVTGGFAYLKDEYLAHNGYWLAGVAVRWNLDCGVTKHRARALDHQAGAVGAQRAELESTIALQVRSAWLDVNTARARIGVAELAAKESEENLRVARNRYKDAVGSNTEVLDAVNLRTRSSASYSNAVYNAVLSLLRLRRAVGDL